MPLDGDYKILGQTFPKKAVLFGVGGIGVVAVYMVEKKKSAAASAAAADVLAGQATGSDTDPQTGYPYGSTEDQAALAALGQEGLPVQTNGSSFQTGNVIGYDQFGNPIYGASPSASAGTFTNNAEWSQSALALLESADPNDDPGIISAALGAYIAGADLSNDQVTIVQQALALNGPVPVPSSTGYPPSYHTTPSGNPVAPPSTGTGGTSGGTPPTAPVTGAQPSVIVPNVVGQRANTGIANLQKVGLNYHGNIDRNPADTYSINSQTPGHGTKVVKGATIDLSFQTPAAPGSK
jgi:hypothetical protein